MCRPSGDSETLDRPPIPHDGGADESKGIPTYRERLAHGTDQGKWLLEQVNTDAAAKRRAARPAARAFHDMDQLPNLSEETSKGKQTDSLAVRQGALCIDESSGLPMVVARAIARRDPKVLGLAATCALLVVYLLFLR